jgi:AcrR family transcriptional regulator
MTTFTLYGCQVVTEKLTRAAVAERAATLADAEGVEAVTVRRLAQLLGVTPMALYWHFKNKDELLVATADHLLTGVRATRDPGTGWQAQIRAMAESLVAAMRSHPSLADLLTSIEKSRVASFSRASDDALALLTGAGFGLQESFWIASYLLHNVIGLVSGQPGCPATIPRREATEWRRQNRLRLQALPADEYPLLVAYAATLADEPDLDRYYALGLDMMMAGIEAVAATRAGRPAAG